LHATVAGAAVPIYNLHLRLMEYARPLRASIAKQGREPWRVGENVELEIERRAALSSMQQCPEWPERPHCRGTTAFAAGQSLDGALRHGGDSPNFVAEELSCVRTSAPRSSACAKFGAKPKPAKAHSMYRLAQYQYSLLVQLRADMSSI